MDSEGSGAIAPSVWAQVEQFSFVYRPEFCLGYDDWLATDREGPCPSESQPSELPPPKKRKLSLALNKRQPLAQVQMRSRFISPVKETKVKEAAKGVIPDNTKHCNSWAVRAFNAWSRQRNERATDDPIPTDLLHCTDAEVVCKCMQRFVLEVRREDGKPYPPATIQGILSGLNRVLKENGAPFSILDKGNPKFRELLLM